MSDVIMGSVPESNELTGTLASEETIKGNLAMVFGKDGENGKSAYEIAIDNGFEGTEAEWLESLKGEDGEQGERGNSGVYIGSGDMPDDCNVQIDPNGEVLEITHETGNSTTKVMSQKGVTDAIDKKTSFIEATTVYSKNLFNPNSPDWLVGHGMNTSGKITDDSTRIVSNFVSVEPGENLIYSHLFVGARQTPYTTWYYHFDRNKNFVGYTKLDGYAPDNYFTVPDGVSYVRFQIVGYANYTDYMLEKNTEITEYEAYFEPYIVNKIPEEYLDIHIPEKVSELENDMEYMPLTKKPLALPSTIYGFVGVPISLYHYNIMDYNPDSVYIRMTTSNKGKLKKHKWEYTPDSAGTTPIKYNIFNHDYGCLNNDETVNLIVKDTSEKSSLKVLVIGDSTVQAGSETNKMLNLANSDNYDLTLLGTRGTSGSANQHEGRGGWTAKMYVNNASNTSGSVTNAFYNPTTSTFDFSYYMTQQGYDGVDCVFIQLGINDLFSAKNDKELETAQNTYYENIDKMIQSIHAYDSNIKIVINTIIPSDTDQDAFCETYGMVQTVWRNHHNVYLSNRKTIERYAKTSNVYVSWYCAMIDCDNNMTGDVHPNNDGYTELGTQMYGFMRAIN